MSYNRGDFPANFSGTVGRPLAQSVPLRQYTNFKIGGNADYFFEATSSIELISSIRLARKHSVPCYIIGGGYNLLFDDGGFRGLVVKNGVKGIKRKGNTAEIEAFSGTPLGDALQFCIEEDLSGFEFLAGIPGTIGGAVFGNAGAFNQSIGNCLREAVILDERGKQIKVEGDYFKFKYRYSLLREKHYILLEAVFGLEEEQREKIKAQVEENLDRRRKKNFPDNIPCAGSYFKNPSLSDGKRVPAAFFLEKVGAKNLRVGGAAVYTAHANFIINQENASAKDVLRLAQELKQRVKEKFGIELEEEVIYLPEDYSTP